MKNRMLRHLVAFLMTYTLAIPLFAAGDSLEGDLEKLRPFLGTWRGEFKNSTPEKPMIDLARWERALNGQAVRIIHSINDGIYGGESLAIWDAKQGKVLTYYFTTANFRTEGKVTFEQGKVIVHEKVVGDASGTSEVRSTRELRPDGTVISKAEFLKNGAWEPGHEITYRRVPDTDIKFK